MQFFLVCVLVVLYVAFVLSLFVPNFSPHPFFILFYLFIYLLLFIWCLGKAVLRDWHLYLYFYLGKSPRILSLRVCVGGGGGGSGYTVFTLSSRMSFRPYVRPSIRKVLVSERVRGRGYLISTAYWHSCFIYLQFSYFLRILLYGIYLSWSTGLYILRQHLL